MARAAVLRSFSRTCLIIFLSSVVPVHGQTVTIDVEPQPASQVREGEVVKLHCLVDGFHRWSAMSLSWTGLLGESPTPQNLTWFGMIYRAQIADPRYSVVNNTGFGFAEHTLVINRTETNHTGTYNCRVMQFDLLEGNNVVLAAEQVRLAVYPSHVFPNCSPSGAAEVPVCSPMSCTVNTSAFVLDTISNTQVNWTREEPSLPGRLTSTVSSTDDGQTYNCSSVAADYLGLPFTCLIGPLSVPSSPTTTESPCQDITTMPPSESKTPDVSASPGVAPTPEDTGFTLQPNESPKPWPPATSHALTAILVILVIAACIATVVALVRESRKHKRASETEMTGYHKADAETIS